MAEPHALVDSARALFGPHLEELAGAAATGEIPLTEGVINRLIASKLSGDQAPVTGATAEVQDGEVITVHVGLKPPFPTLRVVLHIDQQPDLPENPVLGLRWSLKGAGPFGLLAAPVLGYLKALPAWVRVSGDRLWIDLAAVLRQQGADEVLPFISMVRVSTRAGCVVVQFSLRR